jgi:excisionase family DNA binding protein
MNEIAKNPNRLLKAAEAAEYLGFVEGTVRNMVSAGTIPHLKVGRALRFRVSDLDRWLDARAKDAA